MNFSHEFWFQIAVYVIGGFVFVAINSFKVGQLEAKLATKEELKEKVRDRDQKFDRVYQRFDEHKRDTTNAMQEFYVRKDMCGQLHLTTKDDIKKLDEDYKTFRHEIRNQIQMLVDKIDDIRRMISERK